MMFDLDGNVILTVPEQQQADEMHDPARCSYCGKVYDLGMVEVLERYADCSRWKTPCCKKWADDREWTGHNGYIRLRNRHGRRRF